MFPNLHNRTCALAFRRHRKPKGTPRHAQDDRSAAVCGDDGGLRSHAYLLRARVHAEVVRRDGGHADPPGDGARREGGGVHGGRLRARERKAGRVHGADDRRIESGRGTARRLHGGRAGHRHHRRTHAAVALQARLPGSRRRHAVRFRHEVQRAGRSGLAPARSAAPGFPHGDLGRAGPRAPAHPGPSGPDDRAGGRARSAGRARLPARARVPSRARDAARQATRSWCWPGRSGR